jgi:hypothetical protein
MPCYACFGSKKLVTDGGMPKDGVCSYCCCMVTLFTLIKPLKDAGSQYTTKYYLYIWSSSSSWIVFEIFMGLRFCFIHCLYVKKKIHICLYLTLMIKNIMHVFAFKVTWIVHLFKSPLTSRHSTNFKKVHLKYESLFS